MGGLTGALLTGVFCTKAVNPAVVNEGLAYGGGFTQVWIQIISVVGTVVIAVVGTSVILYALKFTMGLRPSEKEEQEGLDVNEHGEESYTGLAGGYSLAEEGSPFSPSSSLSPSNISRPIME